MLTMYFSHVDAWDLMLSLSVTKSFPFLWDIIPFAKATTLSRDDLLSADVQDVVLSQQQSTSHRISY